MDEKNQSGTGDSTLRVGEFLISIGAMSGEQVAAVLAAQQDQHGRLFGEIAIEMGYVDDSAIAKYLDSKYGPEHPEAGNAIER